MTQQVVDMSTEEGWNQLVNLGGEWERIGDTMLYRQISTENEVHSTGGNEQ